MTTFVCSDCGCTEEDACGLCRECYGGFGDRCYFCGLECEGACAEAVQARVELEEYERERATWPAQRCYGRWHWRRWKLTNRVCSVLYVLGVTSGGGWVSNRCDRPRRASTPCPGHPEWGLVAHGPGWSRLDPRRGRVYILGVRAERLALLPTCLRAGHWPLWLEGRRLRSVRALAMLRRCRARPRAGVRGGRLVNESRIPDAPRTVRISDEILGELAKQPAAVIAEFLAVIASIADAPPPRSRLAEHPWGRWARERGLPDAGGPGTPDRPLAAPRR